MAKHIFVTGGVVSSLGKGITAASLGQLLKARGYKVTMQKMDPVSYTHLDVYKRQSRTRTRTRWSAPASPRDLWKEPCGTSREGPCDLCRQP